MNDLHARLTALADDLAPDADPLAQADGARALHRRRRRTHLGMAGVALAVAVVAVGVPAAVSTLATPSGDVAAPGTSAPVEGPDGAAAELSAFADALRAGLARLGVEGPLPDSEQGLPCPDAADALGLATGTFELEQAGTDAGGGTLTGCSWTTDAAEGAAEQRLDVSLRAAFDATPGSLQSELELAEDGCTWTTVLGGDLYDALMRCEGPQTVWTLTVLDDDGTGAWVFTAAVGSGLPEAPRTASSTVAELWRVMAAVDGGALRPSDAPPTPRDRDQVLVDEGLADQRREESDTALGRGTQQMAAALAARPSALSLTVPAGTSGCPDLTTALGARLGAGLRDGGGALADGALGCRWTTTDGTTIGLGVLPITDPAKPMLDAYNRIPPTGCSSSSMRQAGNPSFLSVCSTPEGTDWSLFVLDSGEAVAALLTVIVREDRMADGPVLLTALVDTVDDAW